MHTLISLEEDTLDRAIESFQKEVLKLLVKSNRTPDSLIPHMSTLAKHFLFGGYLRVVSQGKNSTSEEKKVYLTKIEFYFHECAIKGVIKDYGMYHIPELALNDVFGLLPSQYPEGVTENDIFFSTPFPVGSLHTHNSGIDITFDHPNNLFRASILIRGYEINGKYDGRSTYIYDNVLMGNSIIDGNSVIIQWVDERTERGGELENTTRQNLKEKTIENHQRKNTSKTDTRKWQFYIKK